MNKLVKEDDDYFEDGKYVGEVVNKDFIRKF
jgi:hypothetical protein